MTTLGVAALVVLLAVGLSWLQSRERERHDQRWFGLLSTLGEGQAEVESRWSGLLERVVAPPIRDQPAQSPVDEGERPEPEGWDADWTEVAFPDMGRQPTLLPGGLIPGIGAAAHVPPNWDQLAEAVDFEEVDHG